MKDGARTTNSQTPSALEVEVLEGSPLIGTSGEMPVAVQPQEVVNLRFASASTHMLGQKKVSHGQIFDSLALIVDTLGDRRGWFHSLECLGDGMCLIQRLATWLL